MNFTSAFALVSATTILATSSVSAKPVEAGSSSIVKRDCSPFEEFLSRLPFSKFICIDIPPPPPQPASDPAAPAPPPPPPPPPPCPPAAVAPGPFLIFFDFDQSTLTDEAKHELDVEVEQYAATGQVNAALAGHTDRSGNDAYNLALSQRRADAVKAYMVTKGVPDDTIDTEAFGESRPLIDTADGAIEPQNRRVEIDFSGAPSPVAGMCTPQ